MGYRTEKREEFMRDEWPVITHIIDMAVMTMPSSNVVDHIGKECADELLRKLVRIAHTLKGIIDDDQAEIGALKAINKAKEH